MERATDPRLPTTSLSASLSRSREIERSWTRSKFKNGHEAGWVVSNTANLVAQSRSRRERLRTALHRGNFPECARGVAAENQVVGDACPRIEPSDWFGLMSNAV